MTYTIKHEPLWETKVFVREKGRMYWRLMNKITSGSKFYTIPSQNLHLRNRQKEVAEDIVRGWIENGGMGDCKFKVVQTDTAKTVDDGEKYHTHYYGVGAREAN